MAKSTDCSSTGFKFSSQHAHCDSWPSVTPLSGNPKPSSDPKHQAHTCICSQNTHAHKINVSSKTKIKQNPKQQGPKSHVGEHSEVLRMVSFFLFYFFFSFGERGRESTNTLWQMWSELSALSRLITQTLNVVVQLINMTSIVCLKQYETSVCHLHMCMHTTHVCAQVSKCMWCHPCVCCCLHLS